MSETGHFESLFDWKGATTMLTVQYRMHPAIAEFPNQMFYRGMLKTADVVEKRSEPWQRAFTHLRDVQKPYIMFDTSEVARRNQDYRDVRPGDSTSRYNLGEIDVVVGLLHKLNDAVVPIERHKYSVIVLSPYKRQVCVCGFTVCVQCVCVADSVREC